MAVTYASFKIRFPELKNVQEDVFNGAYSGAVHLVNSEVYNENYDEALSLLTAHYVILGERRGNPGATTSEKVGDLAVSYANSQSSGINSTSYGQSFLNIRRRQHFIPFVLWQ